MKVKKYRASSLPEALRLIKRDLGPEAVIVHSQRVPKAGLMGVLGQETIEVIAAVDSRGGPGSGAKERSSQRDPGTKSERRLEGGEVEAGPVDRIMAREIEPDARDRSAAPRSLLSNGNGDSPRRSPYPPVVRSSAGRPPVADSHGGPDPRELLREVSELRSALTRLTVQGEFAGIYKLAPSLVHLHQALIAQEVEPELAYALVTAVHRELSEQALQDPDAVADSVRRQIQRLLPVSGSLQPGNGNPLVLFLIGPTGVGKTTTLAKLAASFALERQRVVLVTTDTFRIAAIPQLQTYAEIIGVPVEVVYTPAELAHFIASQSNADVFLIDTPGRSQHSDDRLGELRTFVESVPGRTVLLTVSAATKYSDMRDIVDRFGMIPFDGLLITKLDETATYGPIVNLMWYTGRHHQRPRGGVPLLSYLTTGQNVPSDIEVASGERVAWLVTEANDA